MPQNKSNRGVVLFTVLGILGLSLFLQHTFSLKQAVLFLTGVGLGVSLLHAAFSFSRAWRVFIRRREGEGIRAQLLLFMLASLLFFPILGHYFPGISVAGALGPVGISVLTGAFLFGIGMELGNGCGSGTSRSVGGGHVNMLVTLTFFYTGLPDRHGPFAMVAGLAQPGKNFIDRQLWLAAGSAAATGASAGAVWFPAPA